MRHLNHGWVLGEAQLPHDCAWEKRKPNMLVICQGCDPQPVWLCSCGAWKRIGKLSTVTEVTND